MPIISDRLPEDLIRRPCFMPCGNRSCALVQLFSPCFCQETLEWRQPADSRFVGRQLCRLHHSSGNCRSANHLVGITGCRAAVETNLCAGNQYPAEFWTSSPVAANTGIACNTRQIKLSQTIEGFFPSIRNASISFSVPALMEALHSVLIPVQ